MRLSEKWDELIIKPFAMDKNTFFNFLNFYDNEISEIYILAPLVEKYYLQDDGVQWYDLDPKELIQLKESVLPENFFEVVKYLDLKRMFTSNISTALFKGLISLKCNIQSEYLNNLQELLKRLNNYKLLSLSNIDLLNLSRWPFFLKLIKH